MAGLADFVKTAFKDTADSYESHAFKPMEEGASAAEARSPLAKARMAYHETMLGDGASNARRVMGYGVPLAATAGMAVGAYQQNQNGNAGGATILGAGATVMGSALALAHFGGVAEQGLEHNLAQKVLESPQVVGTASEHMGTNDAAHAELVVGNASKVGGAMDKMKEYGGAAAAAVPGIVAGMKDFGTQGMEKATKAMDSFNARLPASQIRDDAPINQMAESLGNKISAGVDSVKAMPAKIKALSAAAVSGTATAATGGMDMMTNALSTTAGMVNKEPAANTAAATQRVAATSRAKVADQMASSVEDKPTTIGSTRPAAPMDAVNVP